MIQGRGSLESQGHRSKKQKKTKKQKKGGGAHRYSTPVFADVVDREFSGLCEGAVSKSAASLAHLLNGFVQFAPG